MTSPQEIDQITWASWTRLVKHSDDFVRFPPVVMLGLYDTILDLKGQHFRTGRAIQYK